MTSTPADVTLRFRRGQASAVQLDETIQEILAELRDPDSELAREFAHEGLDPAEFGLAHVTVEEPEQGVDPVITPILIGIAINVGSQAIIKAWEKLIWPQIAKRRGGLALGEKLPDPPGQDEQADQPGA